MPFDYQVCPECGTPLEWDADGCYECGWLNDDCGPITEDELQDALWDVGIMVAVVLPIQLN